MTRVRWAGPALEDLRNIDEWLSREASGDPADRMLSAIRLRAVFLTQFPHGGRPYRQGTRILRVLGTPYLVHYRIAGEREVQVLRVRHEREDWQVGF